MSSMRDEKFKEFIERTGTTIKCDYRGFGDWDDYNAPEPKFKWKSFKWRVQIRRGRYAFSVNYYMGVARPEEPELWDVLYNLMSDAEDANLASSLEEFAESYCIDMTEEANRAYANRLYKACLKNGEQLKHLYDDSEMEWLKDIVYSD